MQYRCFSPVGKGVSPITDAENTANTAGNDGTCPQAEDNQVIPSRPVSPDAERALQTCIEEDIKTWSHSMERPDLCYARLVAMAIHASPTGRCTVTEIYAYIELTFKFYREQGSRYWKVRPPHSFAWPNIAVWCQTLPRTASLPRTCGSLRVLSARYHRVLPSNLADVVPIRRPIAELHPTQLVDEKELHPASAAAR